MLLASWSGLLCSNGSNGDFLISARLKSCGDQVFQEEEQNHLSLDLHPSLTAGLQLYFKVSTPLCWYVRLLWSTDKLTWNFSSAFRVGVHLPAVLWMPGNSGSAFPHSAKVSHVALQQPFHMYGRVCACSHLTMNRVCVHRVLLLHMKRFHHDGARLRKVSDAVSVPLWLSLASLVVRL